VVEGGPQVLDKIAPHERDMCGRGFGILSADEAIDEVSPFLDALADQVRLAIPECLQIGQELLTMVVRALDLEVC
jgi:hypothetical protein